MEKQIENIIRQDVKRVFQEYADWDTDIELWNIEWDQEAWKDHYLDFLSEHNDIDLDLSDPYDWEKLTEYAAHAHNLWSTACEEYLRARRELKAKILKMI